MRTGIKIPCKPSPKTGYIEALQTNVKKLRPMRVVVAGEVEQRTENDDQVLLDFTCH